MRILVIDDNKLNLEVARNQLGKEHDVLLCRDADRAFYILDLQNMQDTKDAYGKSEAWGNHEIYRGGDGPVGIGEHGDFKPFPTFDAVLCDMMMPGLTHAVCSKNLPIAAMGYPLLFMALQAGIKRVALVTNCGHHGTDMYDAPYAAIMDGLRGPLIIGDTKTVFIDSYGAYVNTNDPSTLREYNYDEDQRGLLATTKNWKRALDQLINDS